jgi:transaldolase
VFADLSALGIEIDEVTELLETEGVQKFMDSWSILLEGVQQQLAAEASK